jgi:predicted nucleic acid-binding protein
LNAVARGRCLTKIDKLLSAFDTVAFSPDIERHALALLGRHPLRSLDALQLGCALSLGPWGDTEPVPELVCCDRRLAKAGAAERFSLIVEL